VAHPREVLPGIPANAGFLPVRDHDSSFEAWMKKSLQLQADMLREFGTCVFDVTLDCEDGAPVGAEADQAALVASLASSVVHASGGATAAQCVGVRLHSRVGSLTFGLMDVVSAHAGTVASSAMRMRALGDAVTLDQSHHPLVVRAKLEIANACDASGKAPSHCVVTEFRDTMTSEPAQLTGCPVPAEMGAFFQRFGIEPRSYWCANYTL
jgi:citrate lyase subunit beta/citryl-CoA lyase